MQAIHQRIYQMSKFIKLLVFPVLIYQQPIFSNNIAISLDSGYCWGQIGMSAFKQDSILFSSNIALTHVGFTNGSLGGGPEYDHAIVFIRNSFKNIGYRLNININKKVFFSPNSTKTIGNPDTNWNIALNFPDSLIFLDSIILNISSDSAYNYRGIGKWCFGNSGPDIDFGCYGGGPYENYNAIMYVTCNNNQKMKLQIDKVHQAAVKTWPANHPCGPVNYQIDSIHILWAADSMGNGIFKHPPVGVMEQGRPKIPGISQSFDKINIQSTTNSVSFNLPSQSSPIKSLKIYSLNGSLVNQWQNPGRLVSWRTKGVMAGVYLVDIQFQNQLHASHMFMIKK
jgi:hypothetical protein